MKQALKWNVRDRFLVVPLTRREDVVGALSVGFAEAYEKLDHMYLETVTALAAAMEAKDQDTASHADSPTAMAVAVGGRMQMTDGELRLLQYAAVLHDIGKIGIPGNILNKPDKLTCEELETTAPYIIIGERIISRIDYLVPIASIIRSAHARWDGAGYPDGVAALIVAFLAVVGAPAQNRAQAQADAAPDS